MADAITSYINTLIFCIIAKATSLLLFILLLFRPGWAINWLILTVEIGLIAIIVYTLYQLYAYQKAIDEAAAAVAKAPAMLDTCPDFFVRSVQDETRDLLCNSTYTTPDQKYTYTFTQTSGGEAIPTQNMSAMVNSSRTLNELCTSHISKVAGFSWSDLKSRCAMLDNAF